ncbi:MAG TPA: hypothetical protein VIZ69_09060 [Thermoanaerobaculia bacterium]
MNRKLWTTALAGLILGAFLEVSTAQAAPRVYVRVAPPAPIVETVPAAPSPRHVWVGGYHRWDGRSYAWVPGHYVVRPRAYRAWVPGHWARHRRGYYWVPGHWRR